jgi:hypothetical protein
LGGVVLRISISYFYDIGANFRPLKNLKPGVKLSDVWMDLYSAETAVNGLHSIDWLAGALRPSYALGFELSKALSEVKTRVGWDAELTAQDVYTISSALAAYEPVLRADLSVIDAYFVTRKSGYDTLSLIQNAEVLFPDDLSTKVPAAVHDIREAGRCLAFELCTAAGIHILRALELVLKAYFKSVTSGGALPTNRNLGAYIKKMEMQKAGDPKTLAVLTQIKDLHRNSLMHPEDILSKEDAISLFGIVFSAMRAMLKSIPDMPAQASHESEPVSQPEPERVVEEIPS